MTRFSITFLTVFVLCGVLSAGAQEMMWENITALHFAATGGTDEEHALQQWLLFDTEVAEANADLFDRYKVFCEEFTQMTLNGRSMVGLKELEESEAEIRRMIKEHPHCREPEGVFGLAGYRRRPLCGVRGPLYRPAPGGAPPVLPHHPRTGDEEQQEYN